MICTDKGTGKQRGYKQRRCFEMGCDTGEKGLLPLCKHDHDDHKRRNSSQRMRSSSDKDWTGAVYQVVNHRRIKHPQQNRGAH